MRWRRDGDSWESSSEAAKRAYCVFCQAADRLKRGPRLPYFAADAWIGSGACARTLFVGLLRTFDTVHCKMPRHDSSKISSWCLKPLPPFTSPRSRIKQYRPLLMRTILVCAKLVIMWSMHCRKIASILDNSIRPPVLSVCKKIVGRSVGSLEKDSRKRSHFAD